MSLAPERQTLLRALPRVDDLMAAPAAASLVARFSYPAVLSCVRSRLEELRARIVSDGPPASLSAEIAPATVLAAVGSRLEERAAPALCRVVNATGVVLHTGLGRAPLSPAAQEAVAQAIKGYSLLEVDRASGERGVRETAVARLLVELTGAEAATVVNNNAAATLLLLAAVARGREVICSRGQLVEIGGSFRIPEVMEESGARLVSVGATNKTHLADYERAIGRDTAALLRVHTSNYRLVGFTSEVPLADLVALGKKHGLPVLDDLGSGALVDLAPHGLPGEPLVRASIETGAALVCFSGDKLLGGPQAGIIVGQAALVAKIRRHPLFRALRPGKMTLAALEATLKLHSNLDRFPAEHTTFRMLTERADAIEPRARALAAAIQAAVGAARAEVAPDQSEPGSGSLPAIMIPTWVVRLTIPGLSAQELASRLRAATPPVFTRIHQEQVLLDPRTLLAGDEADLVRAVTAVAAGPACAS